MCFCPQSASALRKRRRPSLMMSPASIEAVLDLSKTGERSAHDLLRRVASGRWPMGRLLGMRRLRNVLFVTVEWVRWGAERPFSLVEIALDHIAMRWRSYLTAAAARHALLTIDADNHRQTAAAAVG